MSKKQKSRALEKFCKICHYSRKYAIRILNGQVDPFDVNKQGRPPTYNATIVWHLRQLWGAMNYCGSKSLVKNLPEWMPLYLERVRMSESVKLQLMEISPATVDRLLKADRKKIANANHFADAIVHYIKIKFSLLIAEQTAVEIKNAISNSYPFEGEKSYKVKGLDLIVGSQKTIQLNGEEIRNALCDPGTSLVKTDKQPFNE